MPVVVVVAELFEFEVVPDVVISEVETPSTTIVMRVFGVVPVVVVVVVDELLLVVVVTVVVVDPCNSL